MLIYIKKTYHIKMLPNKNIYPSVQGFCLYLQQGLHELVLSYVFKDLNSKTMNFKSFYLTDPLVACKYKTMEMYIGNEERFHRGGRV